MRESKIISRRTVLDGRKFSFESVRLRSGSGREMEREFVRHPGAVVIVPILQAGPSGGGATRVVMIRNHRFGLGDAGEWLLECPAGTLEKGEEPTRAAHRELEEETGYRADRMVDLGWFYTTPGMTDEKMYAFAACGLTHVGQRLEEDEAILVELVEAAGVVEMARCGELRDGKSIVAVVRSAAAGLM